MSIKGSFSIIGAFLTLLLFGGTVSAQRLFDAEHLISVEPGDNWIAVLSVNAGEYIETLPANVVMFIGADPRKPGLMLFKAQSEYHPQEPVANIQIAVHDAGGLRLKDEDLDLIQRRLEELYSSRIGSRFRMFIQERSRIGGTGALRITGVYIWNGLNIKILQYLIPGSDHLYSMTYTAKELDFPAYLQEVESIFQTVSIADAPLEIDWLWDILRFLSLLGLLAIVIFGILFATSIKPASSVSGLLRSIFGGGAERKESSGNPFMKKK